MMEDNERQSYNQEDQDDFGLPEPEYSPLQREEEYSPVNEQQDYYQDDEDEKDSKSTGLIVFGILSLVLIVGLVVYLFLFDGMAQVSSWFGEEPAPTTTYVEPEPEPIIEDTPESAPEEPVTEVNSLIPYSDISTISEPTGRSFIVIGSFVDEDLAMDYANKLMEEGIGTRILSPTDRAPLMHRIAVADFTDFNTAMQQVQQFRDQYGDNTWVLKY
ncbi:hypothetical protein OKW21_002464 [Catalinimonas alkaloidigena]|uniref:SPOR domain-containing protein n=1 Tax=Catalinimonas alkaloidigena TaxID=1075417 RepID=UPI002404AFE8|nr:hypothetical protein [Catalinimonas alkaloidigena]MDF9797201.1 hypothetical protein [Catalinimonas alkaloidigena]